ncbi:MAG TPA: HD domain-containing protein [Candidatus Treponema faecavium]|nr:HD domain-containing protein [Candidatus Treponema faecavium]
MKQLEAVIEIGSTGIRMLVAEVADGGWEVIDHAELPAALGRDVFNSGSVSRETLLQCLHILRRFKEELAGWAITPEHVQVIATSAIRAAKNRDAVLDRIQVKTGFHATVIDGIEENRLMYLAVTDCLKKADAWPAHKDSIILEVGGGSTEIMLIEKGKMAGAHSLRLGTVIIAQQLKASMSSQHDAKRFLEEFIRNTGGSLSTEINLHNIEIFIAVGTEACLAAAHAGTPVSPYLSVIKRDVFDEFVDRIQEYSIEECAARFKIPYYDAQSLSTNLLAYRIFMKLTGTKKILVPQTSLREGLIITRCSIPNETLMQEFRSQIVASALALARKYRFDEQHAEHVCTLSLQLFDALKQELGLDENTRTLLHVSAILHDVGMFIRGQDHQVHSAYIIRNSDIFGLSRDEMNIIAQIAYYHRGEQQPQDDETFLHSPRQDRITILKLAAILRVSDALDRGHRQKIQDFSLELTENTLFIHIAGRNNTQLEKLAITEKSAMFESVFGYKVVLV